MPSYAQEAQDVLKALSEEADYAANIEKAALLQTERQALAVTKRWGNSCSRRNS